MFLIIRCTINKIQVTIARQATYSSPKCCSLAECIRKEETRFIRGKVEVIEKLYSSMFARMHSLGEPIISTIVYTCDWLF